MRYSPPRSSARTRCVYEKTPTPGFDVRQVARSGTLTGLKRSVPKRSSSLKRIDMRAVPASSRIRPSKPATERAGIAETAQSTSFTRAGAFAAGAAAGSARHSASAHRSVPVRRGLTGI